MFNDAVKRFIKILNELNINFYLVGGAVRDIIIGTQSKDYDFVAEINKKQHLEISKKLKEYLNCDYQYNEYYSTTKFYVDGIDIDFVMARKEKYDGIASRPTIFEGTLYDDLKRRDYTINTIALDMINYNYIDIFNGINDIKNKKIVVLHDKSYMDDPTRFFRGIKYAARFNFNFDKYTFNLMKECIKCRLIDYLPISRVRSELDLIMNEENFIKALYYLYEFNFFNTYFNFLVNINFDLYNPIIIENEDKYVAIFYKNSLEALENIKNKLCLSNDFLEKCLKLNELNDILNYDDYKVYEFLFKNRLNKSLLKSIFNDRRINKYINYNEIKVDYDLIKSIEPNKRKEFILDYKIKHLLNEGD
ncbi:CCA tRNA nucleotidyltransferase [Thermobrachium celere]|uniref:tRNA nucleotidyltransferase n=1 Tax=Thermobrachium celere DSM 8682 TaxID=941824 RepID=R7RSF5_9CLOT|nr:CCA tRNA nucleotidyltransferase [Thermobrachium celere]CDF58185.1 tRNA nucleotidyltransferase [Thermobrachium celere DSM 8682]